MNSEPKLHNDSRPVVAAVVVVLVIVSCLIGGVAVMMYCW